MKNQAIAFYFKIILKLKFQLHNLASLFRIITLNVQGASIKLSTSLSKVYYTWPHKLVIGKDCIIEQNCFFKFDGPYSSGDAIVLKENIFIGSSVEFNIKGRIEICSNTLIGSGSRFVDHDHGIERNQLIKNQECPTVPIFIDEDVWVGCNVVVLKGVTIGKGAIIAAGAVLNKSVAPYEIWAGVPAKKIGIRH